MGIPLVGGYGWPDRQSADPYETAESVREASRRRRLVSMVQACYRTLWTEGDNGLRGF